MAVALFSFFAAVSMQAVLFLLYPSRMSLNEASPSRPLYPAGGPQDSQHDHRAGDAADGARLDELVETVREGELSQTIIYEIILP